MSPCQSKHSQENVGSQEVPRVTKVLKERVNRRKLEYVLANLDNLDWCIRNDDAAYKANQETILKKYLGMVDEDGYVTVHYSQTSDHGGRLQALGALSLQGITRYVRHTISAEFYWDIDFVNCHPTLLRAYCEENEIRCVELGRYIDNRETYLGLFPKMSRGDMKMLFLSILNGKKRAAMPRRVFDRAEVVAFYNEVQAIHASIVKLEPELTAATVKVKDHNVGGCVTNKVMCRMEQNGLMELVGFLESSGLPVDVLCFDGAMVKRRADLSRERVEEVMRAFENFYVDKTGIPLKLDEKGMNLGINVPDEWVSPVAADYGPLRELEKIRAFITSIPGADQVQVGPSTNGLYMYNSPFCMVCGDDHGKNKGWLRVNSTGGVTMGCHNKACTHRSRLVGNIKSDTFTPGSWENAAETIHGPEVDRVKPIVFRIGCHILVYVAGMGTGKTYQLWDYIRIFNPKRILWIGPRQSYEHSIFGLSKKCIGEAFVHYNDSVEGNRVIVQYESLHRVSMQEPWDLVILDEFRSTLACAVCITTNGRDHLADNWSLLRALVTEYASKVIILDADLDVDDAIRDTLVGSWFKGRTDVIQREVYTCHRGDMTRSLSPLPRAVAIPKFLEMASEGKKIGVPCRSKDDAYMMGKLCQENGISCKVFTGDSSTADKKLWMDPNKSLQGFQVVVFTSTVTVGSDITIMFDVLFAITDTRGGASAREMHQMFGRFRKLRDNNIYMTVPAVSPTDTLPIEKCGIKPFPAWKNALKKEIEVRRKRKDDLQHLWRFEACVNDGRIDWAPDSLTMVSCHDAVDVSCDLFYANLFRIADSKGYPIWIEGETLTTETVEQVTEAKTRSREEIDAEMAETLKLFIANDCRADEANQRKETNSESREDNLMLQVAYVYGPYARDGKLRMSEGDILEYPYRSLQYINPVVSKLSAIMRLPKQELIRRDTVKPGSRFVDMTHKMIGGSHLRELLSTLTGVENTGDGPEFIEAVTSTTFSHADFMKRLPDVQNCTHRMVTLTLQHFRPSRSSDAFKALRNKVKSTLKRFGFDLYVPQKDRLGGPSGGYKITVDDEIKYLSDISKYYVTEEGVTYDTDWVALCAEVSSKRRREDGCVPMCKRPRVVQ